MPHEKQRLHIQGHRRSKLHAENLSVCRNAEIAPEGGDVPKSNIGQYM